MLGNVEFWEYYQNVEMLKNVGTKINYFDANNFIFR